MANADIIKVATVDDHPLTREGIVKQLISDKEITVIMEAKHGLDMLQQLNQATMLPDIAVVDVRMPVMDGFELTDELRNKYPQIRVLIFSAFCSEYNIAAMISKGARGYLIKESLPKEFKKAIHDIYDTGYYYSKTADEQAFKMFQGANIKAASIPEREMEFLKYCATELRYDEIAEKMGISMSTLKGCKERLFERLGVSSRIALVVFAMQSGISAYDTYQSKNLKFKY